ncbi:hypothetical protein [Enterococcus gallinarum]|uniref:HTH cro/C1-type domain-containing protein n=1 Tax=Enterococcus gallinarum TaxID=1353 RepID=A0ABD4ZXY3_ENTGA|nr:hypothetical protein [Enterococcus gallinarum]MBF0825890.1 hypothetical protein [Enterococcus faecalis]MBF0726192.1 hypothetical protein [Enterococcus gallinarum]MBF0798958.1 hypothetical protein [Enterococcus gallinarum]MBX8979572.1 hypothetical protein [Enterococcus gallinarum]MDL4876907.1 hypothetical protein [Enterococcus gallinarum]
MIQLDFYAIITAIEIIRTAKNIKQSDLINGIIDPSNYTKIKKGQLNINIEDAHKLLARLNATWEDVEDLNFWIDKFTSRIRAEYIEITSNPIPCIKTIETFYIKVEQLYQSSAIKQGELKRIYFLLKAFFSEKSNIIPPISKQEINDIFNQIKESEILTTYDYKLIGDLTSFFTIDQIKDLKHKVIITDLSKFKVKTKTFQIYVPSCQANIADILIDNQEFELAKPLIKNLKKISIENNDFFYFLLSDFLNYRLKFLKEKNIIRQKEILKEFDQWFKAAEIIYQGLPGFINFKNSFNNLKKNVYKKQFIIKNT